MFWLLLSRAHTASGPSLQPEATSSRQARGLQGRELGHLIWADSKDIPHYASYSVIKGIFRVMVFAFCRNCHVYQFPTPKNSLDIYLSAGMKWWINFFFFSSLSHVSFAFCIKPSLSQPMLLSILFSFCPLEDGCWQPAKISPPQYILFILTDKVVCTLI